MNILIYSINEIKQRITPVADKHNLKAVYLFGSYARNEATEDSDVDMLVDTTGSPIFGVFALGGLYGDLEEALEKSIDMVTTDAFDGEDETKPRIIRFKKRLMAEKIPLYSRYMC